MNKKEEKVPSTKYEVSGRILSGNHTYIVYIWWMAPFPLPSIKRRSISVSIGHGSPLDPSLVATAPKQRRGHRYSGRSLNRDHPIDYLE